MSFLRLDDYTVPGHDLKVSVSFDFKKEDASGDSSSTAKASKGTKAKRISVSLKLKYKDEALLRELVQVAQAKAGGDGKIYTLTNDTANVMGVRQAAFADKFQVTPQAPLNQWQVSFTLEEHNSVPEMVEIRTEDPEETVQGSPGDVIAAAAELTAFEKWVKGVDDKIGPAG